MSYKDILQAYVDNKNWGEIIEAYQSVSEEEKKSSYFSFYTALAYFESGDHVEAYAYVIQGLESEPHSSWGRKLLYKYEEKEKGEFAALSDLYSYIVNSENRNSSLLDFFVQRAANAGEFSKAVFVNEMRGAILNGARSKKYAIAIQCFNKPDTLDSLFQSLVECDGNDEFSLVIIQDAWEGSKKEEHYRTNVEQVQEVLSRWFPTLFRKFVDVTFIKNEKNLGTAPSCRKLLDYTSRSYEGFVFFEDDCVLSPSALSWALYCLEEKISFYGCWFATCESVFFDSRGGEVPDQLKDKLVSLSMHESLVSSYCELQFVPSTCFITKSKIWDYFSSVRSFPKGPESLNLFFKLKGGKTIFPIVPRVKDVGMLHELGYSVSTLGKDNVKEIKSTYLLASENWDKESASLYSGDLDLLFSATSKINSDHVDKLIQNLS